MSKETFQLNGLRLKEVSFVDRGANQKADILLFKKESDMDKAAEPKKTKGVKFVVGFKEAGGSEVQSVIFSTEEWDADSAKTWLKDHEMVSSSMDEGEDVILFRQKDPKGYVRLRTVTPGSEVSKALRQRQSFNAVQNLIDNAVREKYQTQNPGPGEYLWVRDVFANDVVFDQDGQCWRASFETSRDAEGKLIVTVGERNAVEVVYSDVIKRDTVSDVQMMFSQVEAQVALATAAVLN